MPTLPGYDEITELPAQVTGRVGPEHLDQNGHMNIRHYFGLGDQTLLTRFEELGFGDGYLERTGFTTFTAEHHLRYFDELRPGSEFSTHTRLLARSAKSLHVIVLLTNRSARTLAFTFEAMILHIDIAQRRTALFPDEVATALDAAIARDNSVDWTAPLGGAMAIRGG
ncbi:thioesterase family protein [Phytohabitans kaempferiae]|uniref:Thioesterase family protein n=1 Tax=Phytohabitans kaempferiae TaxID=1620943 RepID=A0ABV6M9M9_9ACTN